MISHIIKKTLIFAAILSQNAFSSTYSIKEISSPQPLSESKTFETTLEPKKYATGFVFEKGWFKKIPKPKDVKLKEVLPRHFDWREKATLSAPKNQGACGSCWAHSMTAVLQDVMIVRGQPTVNLSEQYLLSCNTEGWGCNGGNFNHDYHKAPLGGVPFSEFPYVGSKVNCKQNLSHPYKLDSWSYVASANENAPPDVTAIKSAIFNFGPISAAVAANDAFMSYKSGVFNQCDNTKPNHAIVLVGWDDDSQSFIMKNSWGTWGDKGYMNIKYGCNYIGIAANYIKYTPPASPGPTPTPVPPTPVPTPKVTPTPTPTNPVPPPSCTPAPVASVGKGTLYVRQGQWIQIGMMPVKGTYYHWEDRYGRNFSNAPYIALRVMTPNIFTLYATTRCGTAKASVYVNITR